MALSLLEVVNADHKSGINKTPLYVYTGSITANTDELVHNCSNASHYVAVMSYQYSENQALDLIWKSGESGVDTLLNLDLPAHSPKEKSLDGHIYIKTKKGGDLYIRSTHNISSIMIEVMEFDGFMLG